jgi:hypothetical protein
VIHAFAVSLVLAQLCPAPASVSLAQHGGLCYPVCPSFELTVQGTTAALTCQGWVIPDGSYTGSLNPADAAVLACLASDLAELQAPVDPPILLCRHSPEFSVHASTAQGGVARTSACVGQAPLAAAHLSSIYELVQRIARNHCWSPAAEPVPPAPSVIIVKRPPGA